MTHMPFLKSDNISGHSKSPVSGACQRLFVAASGSAAVLRCLEKTSRGGWTAVGELGDIRGFIAGNGLSGKKREGDGCSPAGLYRLGTAFGVRPRPDTKMPWRPVTPASYWVDDPESPHYNRWVEAPDGLGRFSAEHLIDYPEEYAYAVVIEYNTGAVGPGRGSAIFLHCGLRPTSGCVAVGEADLLRILGWLDPAKRPEILLRPID